MSKFWMMGGAIIAVSVAAMAWNTQPVRSSEILLAKAQSEFAMKARDALIQRQLAPAKAGSAVTTEPKSETLLSNAVASLEPVAATVVARNASLEASIPEPQTTTATSVEASISREVVLVPAPSANPPVDETMAATLQMASLQASSQVSEPPKLAVALAPASEFAKPDTPIVTPTHAAPRQKLKAERKTRYTQKQPRTNAIYLAQGSASRHLAPYNLESLRAHAPQIAAAIARHMNQ